MWLTGLPEQTGPAFADQLSALAPPADEISLAETNGGLPALPRGKAFWQTDWFLAMLVLGLACCMLIIAVDRREIAHRWPQANKFYDAVGLHIYHIGEGLSLRQVRSEIRFEGQSQLAVEGQIHNDTDKPQTIPPVLAAAIGPDGKIMQSWQIDPPAATLAPGESVPFTSEIHAPQGTVTEINLHFVEHNDAQ